MISSPDSSLRTLLSHEQGRLAALERLKATSPELQSMLERLILSRRSNLSRLEALLQGGVLESADAAGDLNSGDSSRPGAASADFRERAPSAPMAASAEAKARGSVSSNAAGLKAGQALLESTRPLTSTVQELNFAAGRPVQFRPGQHVKLRVPVGGSVVTRDYSIARCVADQGRFALWIKRVPGGGASSAACDLPAGSVLEFGGPAGSFVLTPSEQGVSRVVFVGTGTGLAPLAAMLEALLNTHHYTGPVELLWGLRTEADVFFEEELQALRAAHPNFSFTIALSEPSAGSSRYPGRVTTILSARPESELKGAVFYMAGNGMMIDEVITLLSGRGVPSSHIRTEAFFKR